MSRVFNERREREAQRNQDGWTAIGLGLIIPLIIISVMSLCL